MEKERAQAQERLPKRPGTWMCRANWLAGAYHWMPAVDRSQKFLEELSRMVEVL
jgi:hypothetical protein